jgi:hypothetical protein
MYALTVIVASVGPVDAGMVRPERRREQGRS